jgi:broad specificity phosphatase PhoE
MELVLVRHGETEYNRADVFRGRIDLPLNERGRMQARAAAEHLSATPFQAFCSSPLLRSMETAGEIAAPHQGEVTPLDSFIDVDYGHWSGKSIEEVRSSWPKEFALWASDPERAVFPGGESMQEVRERLEKGLETLARDHDGGVLLVGHKLINRVILCIVLGLPTSGIWKVEQSNGAINIISRGERGWMLQRMNDVSHLEGIESNDQQT